MTTFEQVAVLMLYLSHYFHISPFVHFRSKSIRVMIIIAVFLSIKRGFVQLSRDSLTSNTGSNNSLGMNKAFNNRNDVSILRANINH